MLEPKLKNKRIDVISLLAYYVIITALTLVFFLTKDTGLSFSSLRLDSLFRVYAEKTRGDEFDRSSVLPILTSLQGQATAKNTSDFTKVRSLKEGDRLSFEETIETAASSSVVISFAGVKDQWTMRLGSSTSLQLHDLGYGSREPGATTTFLNLLRGVVYMIIDRRDPDPAFIMNTPKASFAVRGTKFLTVMDDHLLMTVHQGRILAKNHDDSESYDVQEGYTYLHESRLDPRILQNPNVLEIFNTELEYFIEDFSSETIIQMLIEAEVIKPLDAQKKSEPTESTVETTVEEIKKLVEDNERRIREEDEKFLEEQRLVEIEKREHARLIQIAERTRLRNRFIELLQERIERFQEELERFNRLMSQRQRDLVLDRQELTTINSFIDQDIKCLQGSGTCELRLNDVLLAQGFVRLTGNQAYKNQLIAGIEKHRSELERSLKEREYAIEKDQHAMERRKRLIVKAQQLMQVDTDPLYLEHALIEIDKSANL